METTARVRCTMPFLTLSAVLPHLLSGWVLFKLARLCRAARNDVSTALPHLRIALRELAELAMYLERKRDLRLPGFEPDDALIVRMYALFKWEPPNHAALCASVIPHMGKSFNFYSGRGNDFSLWMTAHPNLTGTPPLAMMQHLNDHLKQYPACGWCLKLLVDSQADFLYSPCLTSLDGNGAVHPSRCAGPGLIIALRHGTLPIAFSLRYAQSTYYKKIYWPWVSTLTTPSSTRHAVM
eukprot:s362_g9.t1